MRQIRSQTAILTSHGEPHRQGFLGSSRVHKGPSVVSTLTKNSLTSGKKNRGSSRGAKGNLASSTGQKEPKTATNYAFVPRSACNCPLSINPATNASIRHRTARTQALGPTTPKPPPPRPAPPSSHPLAPAVSMPPHTPAPLPPFWASPRCCAHTSLARTMPFREMRTPSPPSRIAPFPRTPQPSPLRLAPRRTSLICTTLTRRPSRAALELVG